MEIDYRVGQFEEIEHKITEEDLDKFVDLTGDNNPLHTDEEYAAKTSYKKKVVHGMLGASFISTVIGTKLPGKGALWFAQRIEFLLPVRIGDVLRVKATIIDVQKKSKTLELKTEVFNQHKKLVIDGEAKVRIVKEKEKKSISASVDEVRTVLVLGASGGIGNAVVKALAKQGLNVGIHYFSSESKAKSILDSLPKGSKSLLIQGDISRLEDLERICQKVYTRFSSLDAVVNCTTGPVSDMDFEMLSWNEFNEQIQVHLEGSFNLLKVGCEYMKKSKYGKFVFISSQAVDYPFSNLMPYISAKSALEGMAKSAALDLAKHGIRVNVVSPGITDTDLNANLPEKVLLFTEARTPMKRLCKPEDVANVVSFLISPASNFITGETIRVNGGQIMM